IDNEKAGLHLRLASAGFRSGRPVFGAVRAPMGERGLGGDASRIDQRAIEPTGRGTSRRWLARGASQPSPHLQETEIPGTAGLDDSLEPDAARRSIHSHAAGGCRALYRQSAADGAFHRTTQPPAQKAAHLSHYGLSSGVSDRRAWTRRTDSWPALACHAVL